MARILVIDDSDDLRMIYREMLASAGHEVTVAAGGRQGIDHFRAHQPDLVITDLFMPEVDGFETISRLLGEFPSAKIIAMSGHGLAGSMLQLARKFGARQTLQKPFCTEKLLATVEDVLQSKSLPT